MSEVLVRSDPATSYPRSGRTKWPLVTAYAVAYTGFWLAVLTPVVVTLALHVQAIAPDNAPASLSLVIGVGALFALIGGPLFGRLSDRTASRFGMRRPWLVAGTVGGLAGVAIIATAPNVAIVLLGWCLAQLGFNALQAAFMAILPDQFAPHERGTISGVLGICLPLGQIGGTYLVQSLSGSSLLMFGVPAVAGAVTIVGLLVLLPDRRLAIVDRPEHRPGDFVRSFWVDPRRYPDFAWAFASRFLVILAASMFLTYQAFYLSHQLGYARADVPRMIFLGTLVQAPIVVASSLAGGKLSDRLGRRKVFVLGSALIFGLGLVVTALAHNLPQFLIGMAIAGIGSGTNLAVGLALAVDVMPAGEEEAAKNLGMFNIANTMPQMLIPAIAPGILAATGGSYSWLYVVCGLSAAAGGWCISFVRGVR